MQVEDNRKAKPFERLKSSGIIQKLKGIKNIQIIIAILIIAAALIIYSNVIGKTNSKSTTTASVMTEEESRLSSVLGEIEGSGKVSSMITRNDGQIVGVIGIAEGASDITVRLRLLDAAATALGVDKNIVSVYSKSG